MARSSGTFKKGHLGFRNEKNGRWKGDDVTCVSLHGWMRRRLGKATYCCACGRNDVGGRYEWANISKEYKRDINDFKPLCKKCHGQFDNIYRKKLPRGGRKYKGITYRKRDDNWYVRIFHNGKELGLGHYNTAKEAAIVYNVAVQLFFGKDVYLNPV